MIDMTPKQNQAAEALRKSVDDVQTRRSRRLHVGRDTNGLPSAGGQGGHHVGRQARSPMHRHPG